MKIVLVNPPIYDFSAFDFWLKPYGMLTVAGLLSSRAELALFDYLDRLDPAVSSDKKLRTDQWGRGEFSLQQIEKPTPFKTIPRRYKRFGLPRSQFQSWLKSQLPFDAALIQTTMTYWYPGIAEVIEDISTVYPESKIILGGPYAAICPAHARNLVWHGNPGHECGTAAPGCASLDGWHGQKRASASVAMGKALIIENDLSPLRPFLNLEPDYSLPPAWHLYTRLATGVIKLTDGCPCRCTYCSVPRIYKGFAARPPERTWRKFEHLYDCGARDIAFYDDALLFDADHILVPFLDRVIASGRKVNFHTPNALHSRLLTPSLAEKMVQAGFKTFYLGFESSSENWQSSTGSKTLPADLGSAVANLTAAGADRRNITAYIIAAHPRMDRQEIEPSMRMVHDLGIRIMLAEFSPIPNTPDGDACAKLLDLSEPLNHNKTAWPIRFLGEPLINDLKHLCKTLNNSLTS